ncbi:Dephospho-CoA kinase [Chlorociboria aeruginascens]|nr:Dephospho-CoA kinase [Chlorociboria aeruginascens]
MNGKLKETLEPYTQNVVEEPVLVEEPIMIEEPVIMEEPLVDEEPPLKSVIVARIQAEDASWVYENFNANPEIRPLVYTADDPLAPLHPPQNKANEVMIYLTYIIDHYYNLSSVNIFLHAHRISDHTNALLSNDAVETVNRISTARVLREGYMNLRCHWHRGCPAHIHLGNVEEDGSKLEQGPITTSWRELFPGTRMPRVLSQPCCAQFAVSKEAIVRVEWEQWVKWRQWVVETELSNYFSGRVWEYIWQYVFTKESVVCPIEHICYCDGYGVCFGGDEQYKEYFNMLKEKEKLTVEVAGWKTAIDNAQVLQEEGLLDLAMHVEVPEDGAYLEMQRRLHELEVWLVTSLEEAKMRGDVPMHRAQEVGRPWKEGDGF